MELAIKSATNYFSLGWIPSGPVDLWIDSCSRWTLTIVAITINSIIEISWLVVQGACRWSSRWKIYVKEITEDYDRLMFTLSKRVSGFTKLVNSVWRAKLFLALSSLNPQFYWDGWNVVTRYCQEKNVQKSDECFPKMLHSTLVSHFVIIISKYWALNDFFPHISIVAKIFRF